MGLGRRGSRIGWSSIARWRELRKRLVEAFENVVEAEQELLELLQERFIPGVVMISRERADSSSVRLRADLSDNMKSHRPPRVLLVDDVDGSRDIVREVLESQGIEIVGEADTAEMGIELAVELKPDVVLMDVRMKGINGIEATRRMKRLLPEVKVIVLSVFAEQPLVDEAMEAGATCLVAKGAAAINLYELIMDASGLSSADTA